MEREFFTSLSYLSSLYGIVPQETEGIAFPYNIRSAFDNAARQLKAVNPGLKLIVVQDETHAACLATFKPLDIGMNLYYIPLRPLRDMLRDKRNKKLAAMVLSAYSYLYQVVGIPNYTDGEYVGSTYDMIEEWLTTDPESYEPDQFSTWCSDLNAAKWYGAQISDMMRHPYHLQHFADRVNSFCPANEIEAEMRHLCARLLAIYQQYPGNRLCDNVRPGWIAPQEEDRIYPEQYISFYWDYNDSIYEQLFQVINDDLQEKCVMDEPVGVQLFDRPQLQAATHELDFENRLFELINDLAALL